MSGSTPPAAASSTTDAAGGGAARNMGVSVLACVALAGVLLAALPLAVFLSIPLLCLAVGGFIYIGGANPFTPSEPPATVDEQAQDNTTLQQPAAPVLSADLNGGAVGGGGGSGGSPAPASEAPAPALAAAPATSTDVAPVAAASAATAAAVSLPTPPAAPSPAAAASAPAAAVPAPAATLPDAALMAAAPAVPAAVPAPPVAAAAPPPASTAAPAGGVATGGAAILARLRTQRAAAAAAAAAAEAAAAAVAAAAAEREAAIKAAGATAPRVMFLYASQTGTSEEIAKGLYAEALERGLPAECLSLSQVPVADLGFTKTPVVVMVVSSTGDGDPPDNAALSYVSLKKEQPAGCLAGVQFTLLGLGDSNFTRFMAVPRVFKKRFLDLGATMFYAAVEADEVDGIEGKVDPWSEGLWEPLTVALATAAAGGPAKVAKTETPPTAAAAPAAAVVPVAAAPAPAAVKAVEAVVTSVPAAVSVPDVSGVEEVVPRKEEATYGFNGSGLVDEGADMKGAAALQPLRLQLLVQEDAAVAQQVRDAEAACPSAAQLEVRDEAGLYSAQRPFWAPISDARYETASWSDRKVLHLEFGLEGSGLDYQPGDSLGVVPANSAALVDGVLARLGRSGAEVVTLSTSSGEPDAHLASPASLSHLFTHCVDLSTAPTRSLLRLLAEHCSDAAEKRTLMFCTARAGKAAFTHEILDHQPSLLDLLTRFASCAPPLSALLEALPRLQPRLYSITSAPEACPGKAQVALSVVHFRTRYGSRQGLATSWLDTLAAPWAQHKAAPASPVRVALFLKRSADFKPPVDPLVPVIMIGPGTGVAPFRGFLQRRRAQLAAQPPSSTTASSAAASRGDWTLFFGCRREDEDFLYRSDLEAFMGDGTLAKLEVAFSRKQADKVYVQHLMRQQGPHLADLIVTQRASVFVCGDGGGMAREVHGALRDVLRDHFVRAAVATAGAATAGADGGVAAAVPAEDEAAALKAAVAAADAVLAAMVQERRYVRDIWS